MGHIPTLKKANKEIIQQLRMFDQKQQIHRKNRFLISSKYFIDMF